MTDLLQVNAPDDLIDRWWASGDLRMPGTGWDDNNYRYTEAVLARCRTEGLTVGSDPESACSYFYADEATLRRVAVICDEVAPAMWAQHATEELDRLSEGMNW